MAWVAVDEDGREGIYQFRPKRGNNYFVPLYEYSMCLALPKGYITVDVKLTHFYRFLCFSFC